MRLSLSKNLRTRVVRRIHRRHRRRRRRRAARTRALGSTPVAGSHRARATILWSRDRSGMRSLPGLGVDQRLLAQQEMVHCDRGAVQTGAAVLLCRRLPRQSR